MRYALLAPERAGLRQPLWPGAPALIGPLCDVTARRPVIGRRTAAVFDPAASVSSALSANFLTLCKQIAAAGAVGGYITDASWTGAAAGGQGGSTRVRAAAGRPAGPGGSDRHHRRRRCPGRPRLIDHLQSHQNTRIYLGFALKWSQVVVRGFSRVVWSK